MSFRAYLTINGLLHKYEKCKSHSLLVLQKNSMWRKSGSWTVCGNTYFKRLAGTSQWSNLCTTVKPLGLCILPSSSISLSILSLYFAGVNSLFSFLTMNRVPAWFYMRESPWGLCRRTEDGAIVCWNMTIPDQWNIELRATGHCCSCVVISSSGILQRTGEKSLFSKRLKILELMYLHRVRELKHCQKS